MAERDIGHRACSTARMTSGPRWPRTGCPPQEQSWRSPEGTRADCQSASDRDPGSASKRDPPFLRFERLALAPSELVGVAETGRARVGVCSLARLLLVR